MGALQGQEGNWCLPSPARTSRLIRCRVSPPPLQLPFLSSTRPPGPWPTEETEKPKGAERSAPGTRLGDTIIPSVSPPWNPGSACVPLRTAVAPKDPESIQAPPKAPTQAYSGGGRS